MTEAMLRECVRCKKKYFKEEGCNKMTCECGQVMCYLCRKPVSNDYQHFYGQGGEAKPGLCPLWSNVNQLHVKEMTEAAKKAKEAVGHELPGELVVLLSSYSNAGESAANSVRLSLPLTEPNPEPYLLYPRATLLTHCRMLTVRMLMYLTTDACDASSRKGRLLCWLGWALRRPDIVLAGD